MNIIICKNYDEISKEAFKIVIDLVKNNPSAILGLATGSTPIGLYKLMIDDHQKNNTSYNNIRTVNLDEYKGLSSNDIQSYAHFMKKQLFEGIEIPLANTYIENGTAINEDEECERYNNLLNTLVPDIQILGIGSNAHIAFNEPGTPFDSVTHVVNLKESTIKDNSRMFNSIDEVPTQAFTIGLSNIMNAKKIILIASGIKKAKAVYDACKGKITTDVPASILQNHKDCTIICDEEAASLLNNK